MNISVINTALNRELCATAQQYAKHDEFLCGWRSASKRITPEETYKEVDRIKSAGLEYSNYEVGVLYGRVKSYQGLIYLNQVIPIPRDLWDLLSKHYY
jgi:hypothetical protein